MIEIDGKKRTVCAWIPARGGSKGVPGKALRDLNGKPLIAYTIEAALGIGGVDIVCVNTDDEKIRDVAVSFGAEAPFLRPAELAGDTSSLELALRYQWDWYLKYRNFTPDIHIGMSPTYPFRKTGRIDCALDLIRENESIFNVRSLVQVSRQEDNYWKQENNKIERFRFSRETRDVSEPTYHDCFSFNVVADFRRHIPGMGPTPADISDIESVDIDEMKDLELARFIAANRDMVDTNPCTYCENLRPSLFGKSLSGFVETDYQGVFVHQDYPMITKADCERFRTFCSDRDRIVVAGCEIDTMSHPYRLIKRHNRFYTRYVVDIPQSIRGRRQQYPTVYRYVPALVYLPRGCSLEHCNKPEEFSMFLISPTKSLDLEKVLDAFQIKKMLGDSPRS